MEAAEEPTQGSTSPVLFKKPLVEPAPVQPLVGQLKKNNVGLFIKKKPVEVKAEHIAQSTSAPTTSTSAAKPTVSLLNMMSSYDDSDENSD